MDERLLPGFVRDGLTMHDLLIAVCLFSPHLVRGWIEGDWGRGRVSTGTEVREEVVELILGGLRGIDLFG